MQSLPSSPARRSPVFRLRGLTEAPPVGEWAFPAHGDATLPALSLRSGDVLCVSDDLPEGSVEVLRPRSPGHPMLGHRRRGQLRSLPADLPCSDSLWAPVGSITAVWRRGLSASVAPLAASSGAASATQRAVCVRVPQAAVALVRAEQPELLGAQLQAAAQPGGTVLVFPGSASDARPVAQASTQQLRELAERIAQALGPDARVHTASAAELVVCASRALDLAGAERLQRSLARQLRIPIAVAVAADEAEAVSAARSLGADQLLFVLPVPEPASTAAVRPRVAAAAVTAPALVPAPAPSWPAREPAPRRRARRPAAAGAVQLGLFERAEAA